MKLLKVFSLSLFIFLSFLVVPALAVTPTFFDPTSPKTTASDGPIKPAVLLADVDLINSKIVSQNNNTIKISFDLMNGVGVQSGVKYGVKITDLNYTIDEKIYPESLTLNSHSTISKSITYDAPATIKAGSYDISLSVFNENGFPFGIASLGKIELKNTSEGLIIDSPSCFLQVVGEKDEPHYDLIKRIIDISKDETLRLTCNATNNTDKEILVSPVFETFYRTSFGASVPQIGGDTTGINFNPKETKSFSVILPTVSEPQRYYVKMKLSDSNVTSNTIEAPYILQGTSATIMNLALDKDAYIKGDNATISFVLNLLQSNSIDSRIKNTNDKSLKFAIKASVINSEGQECISPINQDLNQDNISSRIDIPVTITNDCKNPKISATLLDQNGNILDNKDFSVTTHTTNNPLLLIIIIFIGIIIVVGAALYFIKLKKKNIQNIPNIENINK